jgi:hypothetical protein
MQTEVSYLYTSSFIISDNYVERWLGMVSEGG